jgi:hypothetical protein
MLPLASIFRVRTCRPAGSDTVAAVGRRAQWCHWRQARGSFGSFVEGISMVARCWSPSSVTLIDPFPFAVYGIDKA